MNKILVKTQEDEGYRIIKQIWSGDVAPLIKNVRTSTEWWMKKIQEDFSFRIPVTVRLNFFHGQVFENGKFYNIHGSCQMKYKENYNIYSLNFNMGSVILEHPYIIRQCIPHEVMHLACEFMYPEKGMMKIGHEGEWEELMVFYKLPPNIRAKLPGERMDEINNMFLENES